MKVGVRKATSPDEELKIIVFFPSFVLHLINDVLRIVPLGHLKYVHTGAYLSWLHTRRRRRVTQRFPTHIIRDSPAHFVFLTSSPGFDFSSPLRKFLWEKQKSSPIFFSIVFIHRDRGGNRSTHYPGKWIVSVRVRTEHPVQPLLYLSISKPYQLSSTDPPVSTVGR